MENSKTKGLRHHFLSQYDVGLRHLSSREIFSILDLGNEGLFVCICLRKLCLFY